MQVSSAYIKAFVAQLDALNVAAGKSIITEAKKRDIERKLLESELEFEDVYSILASISPQYAKLASALACHFYDGIRQQSSAPGSFKAEVYDTLSKSDIMSAARSVYADVKAGRNTVPLTSLLKDKVSGFTRTAANETVYRNAAKDPAKPRYAVVPSPSACVLCKLVAANGYEYPSEQSAVRHEKNIHDNCNCTATQVYGDGSIQGYDPKKYEDAHFKARDAYESGEISDDLARRIEKAKERHDARYAEYKEKKAAGLPVEEVPPWRETNAILMVWREQQKE